MLTMRDMTDKEVQRYLQMVIPTYASDGARATGMPPDEALAFARSQIEKLLPAGRRPPGQHLEILIDETGDVAGTIWYADELEGEPPRVFLYDIRLAEERRGQGLGTIAMGLFEDVARESGATEVKLHVFTHNEGAIRLYERLGYACVNEGTGGQQMAKQL